MNIMATNSIQNKKMPTLCLYLFQKLAAGEATDILNTKNPQERRFMLVDPNVKISENVFNWLAQNKHTENLVIKLTTGDVRVTREFPHVALQMKNLTVNLPNATEERMLSLMYYYGGITFQGDQHVKIPNNLAREQVFARLSIMMKSYSQSLLPFLENGDPEALEKVLKECAVKITPFHAAGPFMENQLQVLLIDLLRGIEDFGYTLTAEFPLQRSNYLYSKRVDFLIQPLEDTNAATDKMIECKNIAAHFIDPNHFG